MPILTRGLQAEGSAQPRVKPMLNVVAVGVSKYSAPALALNYAAKDALDFGEALLAQRKRAYEQVRVHTLTDERATRANILEELRWLARETREGDVSIFFVAGHGIAESSRDEGRLQILAVDYQDARASETTVLATEIQALLSACKGTVLLFLDTCYSGNVLGMSRAFELLQSDIKLLNRGTVLFAASARDGQSRESERWQNGAFTRAAIEGLSGHADYLGRGEITISALEHYINHRVRELTQNQQTPMSLKPDVMIDYVVTHGRRPMYRRPSFWGPLVASVAAAIGVGLAISQPWNKLPRAVLMHGE